MKDIKDFHERYEMEYTGDPRVLPYDLFQFRVEFMKEEVEKKAHKAKNKAKGLIKKGKKKRK